MGKFLVTGATGHQGEAVARELLRRGATVHALVRNVGSDASRALKEQGAVLFKSDFLDLPAIAEAASHVSGVFLNPVLSPSDPGSEVRGAMNVIQAALTTKTVETVVVSTAYKTDRHEEFMTQNPNYELFPYYSNKSAIERAVRGAGFKHYTIFRPAWLMYNYLRPYSMHHVARDGNSADLGYRFHAIVCHVPLRRRGFGQIRCCSATPA